MIHEEICTYEVCKLAKEKGFPQECDMFYNRNEELCDDRNYDSFYNKIWCFAPTQSLLQRWLREEKSIHIEISVSVNDKHCFYWTLYNKGSEYWEETGVCYDEYPTYELALEDAIKYALENLI